MKKKGFRKKLGVTALTVGLLGVFWPYEHQLQQNQLLQFMMMQDDLSHQQGHDIAHQHALENTLSEMMNMKFSEPNTPVQPDSAADVTTSTIPDTSGVDTNLQNIQNMQDQMQMNMNSMDMMQMGGMGFGF